LNNISSLIFCSKGNIFRFLERGFFSVQLFIFFSRNFDQGMSYKFLLFSPWILMLESIFGKINSLCILLFSLSIPLDLVNLIYHTCRRHKPYKNWTTVKYFFISKIGHFLQLLFDQDIVAHSLWQKGPVKPMWTLDLL